MFDGGLDDHDYWVTKSRALRRRVMYLVLRVGGLLMVVVTRSSDYLSGTIFARVAFFGNAREHF